MHFATLTLRHADGTTLWTGSALEFVRANDLDRDDVADMCDTLRYEQPAQWFVGGGAQPLMYVQAVPR